MAHTAPTDLMLDYYAQYAQQWVALPSALLDSCAAGPCLWLGSYLGLIGQLRHAPDVIADLDHGVLLNARRQHPGVRAVQCDIRTLPFHRRFTRIVAPGCVSAYLLDDHDAARAITSLATALEPRGGNALWLDAYLREEILATDYFNGQRALQLLGQPWQLCVSSRALTRQPWVFEVSLCFTPAAASAAPVRLSYRQRAYHENELIDLLQAQGFAPRYSQHSNGRLGLLLELAA